MKKFMLVGFMAVLFSMTACTTVQTYDYGVSSVPSNTSHSYSPPATPQPGQIQILYAQPQQAYNSLGMFSVRKYKPGWSDPTVSDAIPELRQAAQRLGADAVIIRNVQSQNTRITTIEGEAIRWR